MSAPFSGASAYRSEDPRGSQRTFGGSSFSVGVVAMVLGPGAEQNGTFSNFAFFFYGASCDYSLGHRTLSHIP